MSTRDWLSYNMCVWLTHMNQTLKELKKTSSLNRVYMRWSSPGSKIKVFLECRLGTGSILYSIEFNQSKLASAIGVKTRTSFILPILACQLKMIKELPRDQAKRITLLFLTQELLLNFHINQEVILSLSFNQIINTLTSCTIQPQKE